MSLKHIEQIARIRCERWEGEGMTTGGCRGHCLRSCRGEGDDRVRGSQYIPTIPVPLTAGHPYGGMWPQSGNKEISLR